MSIDEKEKPMLNECTICYQRDNLKILIAKDYFLGSKKEYEYVLCLVCNSLSLRNIPEDLSLLYKNYYSFTPPTKISAFKAQAYKYVLRNSNLFSKVICCFLKQQEDLPIKSIERIKLKKSTKILDVGCGSGNLLCHLYEVGFKNSVGIDPYLDTDIEYQSGLKIKKKNFFDVKDKFDLIMFHHVFEHFPNPKEVLVQIHRLLSDNGMCIIRIPNIDSYSFHRFKENWFSIHAPFHITLPSRKGMEKLLKNTGLIIEHSQGEQLIEFFFYSMGHELGIADYEKYGNRRFIEEYGIKNIPPFHITSELHHAKQRLLQVRKYQLCDWVVYYLKKKVATIVH